MKESKNNSDNPSWIQREDRKYTSAQHVPFFPKDCENKQSHTNNQRQRITAWGNCWAKRTRLSTPLYPASLPEEDKSETFNPTCFALLQRFLTFSYLHFARRPRILFTKYSTMDYLCVNNSKRWLQLNMWFIYFKKLYMHLVILNVKHLKHFCKPLRAP